MSRLADRIYAQGAYAFGLIHEYQTIATIGHVFGAYLEQRDIGGVPTVACGRFDLCHDGTNGFLGWVDVNGCGITAEGSISGGQLRLTLTDEAQTGNPTLIRLTFAVGVPLV